MLADAYICKQGGRQKRAWRAQGCTGEKVNRSKKNARVDQKETCNTEEARSRDSEGR